MLKYILLLFPVLLYSQQLIRVDRIIDGDTFQSNGMTYRIAEIDAPEINQLYGVQSKKYLTSLIGFKFVSMTPLTTDKYGRKIVRIYYNNQNISEKMVASGNAWWYSKYSKNLKLRRLQQSARNNKKGLWKYEHINPYRYRKMERVL